MIVNEKREEDFILPYSKSRKKIAWLGIQSKLVRFLTVRYL
jgi:hypothetical protein